MSSDKKAEKSPYSGHSIEEVMAVEIGHYYIQVGDGIFESDNGKLAFSRDRAEEFMDHIWKGLMEMKEVGNSKERKEAEACFLNLRIIPLRFH